MTLQGTNLSRVFGVYLMSRGQPEEIQKQGGNILSSSHLQLPKQLWFLLKKKKLLSNFLERWASNRSEWSFTAPVWLLCFFLNYFQPQLSNSHWGQPSDHKDFWCVRSQTITAYLQSSFCSTCDSSEDSGVYSPVMGNTQILCRFQVKTEKSPITGILSAFCKN